MSNGERDILSRSPSEPVISVIDRRALGEEEVKEPGQALSPSPRGKSLSIWELRAPPILTLNRLLI